MAMLKIETQDQLVFAIVYTNSQGRQDADFRRTSEGWRLIPRVGAASVFAASNRVDWPEALKRALVILSAS